MSGSPAIELAASEVLERLPPLTAILCKRAPVTVSMSREVLGLMLGLVGCAAAVPTQTPTLGETPAPLVIEPASAPEPQPGPEPQLQPPDNEPPTEGGHLIVGNPDAPKWQRTAKLPSITAHEPVVGTPAIDGDVIRRVVRSHSDAVRACYQLGLDLDPALAGRIAISFTIGPSGAVTQAKAEAPESFPYPQVPVCIADELRTWTFPAPRGGGSVIVSYPFNLVP